MNLLWDLQVWGGKSLWIVRCCKYHIALFSFYDFFPLGFSYKVFNETISTQDYVTTSICPQGFLEDDIWSILTIGSRCYQTKTLNLSRGSTNIGKCIVWCFSLFFPLGFKEFCLVYWKYFGFPHRVFQRFSSHFFWKVFGGVIYIASPDFFHRIFKEFFDWLQDHKKIKLITKKKKIDQGGVLWRN